MTSADDDIDAELLAITGVDAMVVGKRKGNSVESSSSESDSQFEGESDIDEADDNELPDDEDDDDDDDAAYSLDEAEEEEKAAKKKKKTRKSTSTRKAPKKRGKKRSRANTKKELRLSSDEDDSDSDAIFKYKYDEDGYGDTADRDTLEKMNEFDRERVLADRLEERLKAYDMWKMKKDLLKSKSGKDERKSRSSVRNKASSKSDALQALAADKKKKTSKALVELSDADSEGESKPKRRRLEADKQEKKDEEIEAMPPDEGPELKFSDIVISDKNAGRRTTYLFMRRNNLVVLCQKPYFARIVVGLYARIKVTTSDGEDKYIITRIVAAKRGIIYSVAPNMKTNWHLVLNNGTQEQDFQLNSISASAPSEKEFDEYRNRALLSGYEMPRREEVEKLNDRMRDFHDQKVESTDEERKQHIKDMESLYPSRVNWTKKRTDVQTAYDIKIEELGVMRRQRNSEKIATLEEEVKELRQRLDEIIENERTYSVQAGSTAAIFRNQGKRNMLINSNVAVQTAKNQKPKEGINPFARFDTTGQSYFSIKSKGGEKKAQKKSNQVKVEAEDWRACLKTWGRGEKRTFSKNPVAPGFDIEFEGLDDFKNSPAQDSDEMKTGAGATTLKEMNTGGLDEVYFKGYPKDMSLPENAKVMSFDDWTRMRNA